MLSTAVRNSAPDYGRQHRADATGEADAAEHEGGDRLQFLAVAGLHRHEADLRDEHDRSGAGEQPRQAIGGEDRRLDRNAKQIGAFLVIANGIEEAGLLEHAQRNRGENRGGDRHPHQKRHFDESPTGDST